MQKKEKEPPAEKPRGAEKPDKDTERLERERLKKINKLPDYEALFREDGSGKRGGGGFLKKIFRRDRGRLVYSSLIYILKASPLWIMPLVTGDVIDMITLRPEGFIFRILIDAAIFAVC